MKLGIDLEQEMEQETEIGMKLLQVQEGEPPADQRRGGMEIVPTMSQKQYFALQTSMVIEQAMKGERSEELSLSTIPYGDKESLRALYSLDPGSEEFIHNIISQGSMGWI